MNYKIEKLTNEDTKAVFEIENRLIGNASFDKILNSISSDTLTYYVLKVSNQLVGFYELSTIVPEAELFDIAVLENFQNMGYGSILLQHMIDICKEIKVKTIFLEVNKINKKAIHIYEKFGFKAYGIRENYYGKDDAILMKLELN